MLAELPAPPALRLSTVAVASARRAWIPESFHPYLYLLPALAGIAIWVYWPLLATLRYSFTSWDLLPSDEPVNVGLRNYEQVLRLPQLWSAVGVTLAYVAGLALFGVLLPVLIGTLAEQVGARARSFYRTLIFVPVLVSPIVATTIWEFLLAPKVGVVTRLAGLVDHESINWIAQPGPARSAIVMIAGWKLLGISVLIVSAGLAGINGDYYAAAEVDGASRWRQFRSVTLPLLSPTVLFLVMMSVLLAPQITFPLINALTQGGPTGATTDIYYLLYVFGFTSFDVGAAAAAAVLFFVVFGLVAVACVRLQDRLSFYDA